MFTSQLGESFDSILRPNIMTRGIMNVSRYMMSFNGAVAIYLRYSSREARKIDEEFLL
jgi:hypothetical protein